LCLICKICYDRLTDPAPRTVQSDTATLSITIQHATPSILTISTQHVPSVAFSYCFADRRYAECHYTTFVMLSAIMPSVVMPSVIVSNLLRVK